MALAHNRGRRLAITLMTAAGIVFLVSLWVILVYHNDVGLLEEEVVRQVALQTWIVLFVVVLAVILTAMLLVFASTRTRAPGTAETELYEPQGISVPAGQMLLRCGQCANTFTALEISERPYYSTCPHCGARGVLNY